ncbi:MAG: hypothetical protein KTR14_05330 [Vampirovibrio sp.]|nr:hypothetical protein [Vampirovibrio sp.]
MSIGTPTKKLNIRKLFGIALGLTSGIIAFLVSGIFLLAALPMLTIPKQDITGIIIFISTLAMSASSFFVFMIPGLYLVSEEIKDLLLRYKIITLPMWIFSFLIFAALFIFYFPFVQVQ